LLLNFAVPWSLEVCTVEVAVNLKLIRTTIVCEFVPQPLDWCHYHVQVYIQKKNKKKKKKKKKNKAGMTIAAFEILLSDIF
jgi:hypothetical protein